MIQDHAEHKSQSTIVDSSAYSALLLVNAEAASLFRSYLLRSGIVNQQTYQLNLEGLRVVDHQQHLHVEPSLCIQVVLFPKEAAAEGKSFWQHAGSGISSRCATYWLQHGPLRSPNWPAVSMPASLPLKEAREAEDRLRSRIASLASEPDFLVGSGDVFLYTTGMAAIETTASVLESITGGSDKQCRVAIFGFVILLTVTLRSPTDFLLVFYTWIHTRF